LACRLLWLFVKTTANDKLTGDIVELRGRIESQYAWTAAGAQGQLLVSDQLRMVEAHARLDRC
jgi:hypothetical protein